MGAAARPLPPWIGHTEPPSSLARMPMLREKLDGIATCWADRFASFCGTSVDASAADPQSLKWEQLAARCTDGVVLAVIAAPGWGTALAVSLTAADLALAEDALFGGDGEASTPDASTALSAVAQGVAESVARQLAEALSDSFPEYPGAFVFDRVLTKPDLSMLGKQGASIVLARLNAQVLGRPFGLDLLIPLAGLEFLAADIAAPSSAPSIPADPTWTRMLETEVGRALTRLSACIDLPDMSLGAIARLVPGQVLPLPTGANARVRLLCRDDVLFRCELGQADGHYTVRIDETLGTPVHLVPSRAASPMNVTASMGSS